MTDQTIERTKLLARILRRVDSIIRESHELERDRDELRRQVDTSTQPKGASR